jgi:hypothetical protein
MTGDLIPLPLAWPGGQGARRAAGNLAGCEGR